jgi:hypothetical protein
MKTGEELYIMGGANEVVWERGQQCEAGIECGVPRPGSRRIVPSGGHMDSS